jgi:hypothetical protein
MNLMGCYEIGRQFRRSEGIYCSHFVSQSVAKHGKNEAKKNKNIS